MQPAVKTGNEARDALQTPCVDVAAERQRPLVEAILFFDSANQTGDGKTNLLGIFDRIFVPSLPHRTPEFGLFVRVAQAFSAPLQITISSPDGAVIAQMAADAAEGSSQREAMHRRAIEATQPVRVQLLGQVAFTAETVGVYWFAVHYKGEILGGSGLIIERREDASGAEHS